MVFPRNAGFGRFYLVSTRHEILSNIILRDPGADSGGEGKSKRAEK